MLFYFFNDVFLLNLPFESPQRVFQGFSVLKSYFSQSINTPVSIIKVRPTNKKSKGMILTQG